MFFNKIWVNNWKKYTIKLSLYHANILPFRSEKVALVSNISLQLLPLFHPLNHSAKNYQWCTSPTNAHL